MAGCCPQCFQKILGLRLVGDVIFVGRQTKRVLNSTMVAVVAKKRKKDNLGSRYPDVAKEWDREKNGEKCPRDFSPSSGKSVWWLCPKCGHSWQAQISNRTNGSGCPCCLSNKVVVAGKNDLATTHSYLAKEWHPTKNGNLTPQMVTYGAGRKVWWLCPNNHAYEAQVMHRSHGTECPKCHAGRQTSFAEQAVFYYIKKLYPTAVSRYSPDFMGKMELDIYIPSIKLAIEYDGEAWHKRHTLIREQRKYDLCKKHGIKLIRLREKMPAIASDIADEMFSMERLHEPKNLEMMLGELLKHLNYSGAWMLSSPISIDITRDRFEILQYKTDLKAKSLQYQYPDIAKEWHPVLNKSVLPEHFLPGTSEKVDISLRMGIEIHPTHSVIRDDLQCIYHRDSRTQMFPSKLYSS